MFVVLPGSGFAEYRFTAGSPPKPVWLILPSEIMKRNNKVVLMNLDGWGNGDHTQSDAIFSTKT